MRLESAEVGQDLCLVAVCQGGLSDRHGCLDICVVNEDSGHDRYSDAS